MSFTFSRRDRDKIQAVVLDWAGATMDYGCMAPAVVFVEVFKRQGVPITRDEARAPMGAHKRVHLQKISQLDGVHRRWQEARGRPPGEADVDRMVADFVPLQLACLSGYSRLIPGTLEVTGALRVRGIETGSTTARTATPARVRAHASMRGPLRRGQHRGSYALPRCHRGAPGAR
jgi:phosphonoacetaldehyde hydrolase